MRYKELLLMVFCIALCVSFACKKKAPVEPVAPPPPVVQEKEEVVQPPVPEKEITEEELFAQKELEEVTKELKDAFFDFDKYNIREDQILNLEHNAAYFKKWKSVRVLIEGHCDERGTNEYNMALGHRRASAAKDYLVSLGVEESRIEIISYGEERPFALGHNEDAWWQNRRAHFVAIAK